MIRIADVHVRLRPIPQGVEFGFLIELNGNHHAVGHALGTHVVIVPIGEIEQRAICVGTRRKDYGLILWIAVEELLERSVDLCRNFRLRMAGFGEEVAIAPSRKRS